MLKVIGVILVISELILGGLWNMVKSIFSIFKLNSVMKGTTSLFRSTGGNFTITVIALTVYCLCALGKVVIVEGDNGVVIFFAGLGIISVLIGLISKEKCVPLMVGAIPASLVLSIIMLISIDGFDEDIKKPYGKIQFDNSLIVVNGGTNYVKTVINGETRDVSIMEGCENKKVLNIIESQEAPTILPNLITFEATCDNPVTKEKEEEIKESKKIQKMERVNG